MKNPLFRHLASKLQAIANCASHTTETAALWQTRHENDLIHLVKEFMPSGSGIDAGTQMDYDQSNPNKLVFTTSFHHMNEAGYYDGWTEHKVIVTPSLTSDYEMKITGRDRNQIKEYLTEVFDAALSDEIEQTTEGYVSLSRAESVKRFQDGVKAGLIT